MTQHQPTTLLRVRCARRSHFLQLEHPQLHTEAHTQVITPRTTTPQRFQALIRQQQQQQSMHTRRCPTSQPNSKPNNKLSIVAEVEVEVKVDDEVRATLTPDYTDIAQRTSSLPTNTSTRPARRPRKQPNPIQNIKKTSDVYVIVLLKVKSNYVTNTTALVVVARRARAGTRTISTYCQRHGVHLILLQSQCKYLEL